MRHFFVLCSLLLSFPLSAQSSQPSTAPSASQPVATTQAVSLPTSEEAVSADFPEEYFQRVSTVLAPPALVLQGVPMPVRNVRFQLRGSRIRMDGIPGREEAFLVESTLFGASVALWSAGTLELRLPLSFQTSVTLDTEPVRVSAMGNLGIALRQVFGGSTRKAISLEVIAPTASTDEAGLELGARSTLNERYELGLFLPQVWGGRLRGALAKTISDSLAVQAELGVEGLFATEETSLLQASPNVSLRGGFSLSYLASERVVFLSDLVFSRSLTGGEDGLGDEEDGLFGNADKSFVLHAGARAFFGRVSVAGFITLPQDPPFGDVSGVGLGFQLSSAL